MADFIAFDAGMELLGEAGLPTTVSFDLSTKSVDSTSPFTQADTYASRGAITGTGYAAKTASRPDGTGGTFTFGTVTWTTDTATDWPATARSIVAHDGSVAICAWNLQTGGAARDLSGANTTENVQPTLVID
jgi:hypothetical protein